MNANKETGVAWSVARCKRVDCLFVGQGEPKQALSK